MVTGPVYVKVALWCDARAYPACESVCTIPWYVPSVTGIRLPFGATMKNSEILDTDPNEVDGIQPPLTLVVDVRARNLKTTVAVPVFSTVMVTELGVRPAPVIWK